MNFCHVHFSANPLPLGHVMFFLGLCVYVAATRPTPNRKLPWWGSPDKYALRKLKHIQAEWVTLISKSIVRPLKLTDVPESSEHSQDSKFHWGWLGKDNAVSNFAAEVDRGYILCIKCQIVIPEPLAQKLVLVNGRVRADYHT